MKGISQLILQLFIVPRYKLSEFTEELTLLYAISVVMVLTPTAKYMKGALKVMIGRHYKIELGKFDSIKLL